MATVNGITAVKKLLDFNTYPTGLCLRAVSQALGTYYLRSDKPGYYQWALRVWSRTPKARRHFDRTPPKGAAVYFSAGRNGFGHVCLSLGNGRIVSTDVPRLGSVGVTTITDLERAWGRTFVGWSDWFMGHTITVEKEVTGTPAGGKKKHPRTLRRGSRGATVKTLQKALKKRGLSVGRYGADGEFGPSTEQAVRRWQRKKKLTVDGIVGPKTWASLGY